MIEIFKEFTFEAAHHLAANVDSEHPYAQLHGHSFHVAVFFRGELDERTGWIADFASLDAAIKPVRDLLDHHYLNDIKGLERPTLEVISRWIFERLSRGVPLIHRVTVRRGSCGEGCSYEAPSVTLLENRTETGNPACHSGTDHPSVAPTLLAGLPSRINS